MSEYDGSDLCKFKDPIDLNQLVQDGSCSFEIEGGMQDLSDDEVEKDAYEEQMQNKRDFFKNISLKNMQLVQCGSDSAITDFEELETTMQKLEEYPDSGILKKIVRPGRNEKIPPGSKVYITYLAFLESEDEPFDQQINHNHPFGFKLGSESVIPGLDMAVSTMTVKEIAKFLIPPEYAYGPLGCIPKIPPASRVLFNIEVVSFHEGSKVRVFEIPMDKRNELPFEEILKAAEELKFEANRLFKSEDYNDAVVQYSRATEIIKDYYNLLAEDDEKRKNKTLYDLFNNLAMCYFKLEKYRKCIKSSEAAIKIPTDVKKDKPYYRMSKAEFALGNTEKAKNHAEEANRICPNNTQTLELLSQILDKFRQEKSEEKNLWKKMMG